MTSLLELIVLLNICCCQSVLLLYKSSMQTKENTFSILICPNILDGKEDKKQHSPSYRNSCDAIFLLFIPESVLLHNSFLVTTFYEVLSPKLF